MFERILPIPLDHPELKPSWLKALFLLTWLFAGADADEGDV
jgi:hypothetical protein